MMSSFKDWHEQYSCMQFAAPRAWTHAGSLYAVVYNWRRELICCSIKLLGVTMDEHFSWIEHVKALLSSCYGVLSVLRKLRNLAPFHVRKQLGESLILSKLDYSCVVFHPLQLYQQKQLQKVQNVCASFVLGRYAREADSLQLGWLPVADRRQFQVLLSAFKALCFNNWPEYIKVDQYVPGRTLRSSSQIQLGRSNLEVPTESGTFQDSAAAAFNLFCEICTVTVWMYCIDVLTLHSYSL
jgi:hypothetical protein